MKSYPIPSNEQIMTLEAKPALGVLVGLGIFLRIFSGPLVLLAALGLGRSEAKTLFCEWKSI
jgi:hypothetical protein